MPQPPATPRHTVHDAPGEPDCRLAHPRVLSRDELRSLDALAVDLLGVPSILLMENAAIGAATLAREILHHNPGPVLVLAGTGNNGGDGLALARQLHIHAIQTTVALTGPASRLTPDAAANRQALRPTGVPVHELNPTTEPEAHAATLDLIAKTQPALIVDALLGTGLSRPVEGPALGVIRAINDARADHRSTLAIDLPSGLDADTGRPLGHAVRADATATFAALKTGFFSLEAQPCIGRVVLLPIGVPHGLVQRFGAPYTPSPTRHARDDTPTHRPPDAPTRPGPDDSHA